MTPAPLLDYIEARKRADSGMARALDTAERDDINFGDEAFAVLVRLARSQRTVHIDDFLEATELRPSSPNAMGAVWLRAIRARIIKHSGLVRACKSDVKKHAHNYPVYQSLVFEGAA